MRGNTENPYAGQGPVLLDIGGDAGALVVTMPAHTDGLEVELRPAGATAAAGTHGPDHSHDGHDGHHHDGHHHGPGGGRRAGGPAYPHVAVVARPDGAKVVHSLVYPCVTQGTYELYPLPNGPVTLTATVTGGRVVHASWPD
jgi:hypothetical protein